MTIRIYDHLLQGSEEWLEARRGLITASTLGKLVTPKTLAVAQNEASRGLLQTLVAERVSGHVEYVHPTRDMERGTLDEPYARALYAENFAPVREVGFAVRQINGYTVGASPDGLVGEDGGIEIKSRQPAIQLRTILQQSVPLENMAQIQALMLVLDRSWWDYVSFASGWPLFVKRVYPDERWQKAIEAAVTYFESEAAVMISRFEKLTTGLPVAPRIDHFADIEVAA